MKCLHIIPSKIISSLGKIKAAFLLISFVSLSVSSFSQEVVFDRNQADIDNQVSKESSSLSFGLLSFKARHKGSSKIVLSWSILNGANTSHFIMQRSKDGIKFNDAAVLFTSEGNGTEKMDYSYIDNINVIKSGLLFYRLKIVGTNGKSTYSVPVTVRIEKTTDEMYMLVACK